MATDRLTFVAELKDRLTGPAKKAAKAVEDLGKAAEESAKRTEKANTRVERSEAKRARATARTAELATASAKRRTTAEAESARRAVEAQKQRAQAAEAEKRKTVEVVNVVERAEDRRRKTTTATARDEKRKHDELTHRLSDQKTAWDVWRRHGKTAQEDVGKSSRRAADAFDQLSGRAATGLKSMASTMDKVNPGRMASRYDTALNRMLGRTRDTAGKIQSSLQNITTAPGMQGAAMGATAVGGLALAGGVKRVNDVQQANVVMETMGLDEGARGNLMGTFKGLAQDTPFSTGSVANLGSGLISSGMDQSQVEASLQGAIDTAAIGGTSLEDMALPLKQIQAKGRLMGNDLMQLMDRNIPMLDWISKTKGVDRSQVQDLVTKGQVTSEDVFQALAENSKGGAEKASKTLKGSWTNFLSSMSQGGEAFLTPLVGPLTDLFTHGKEVLTVMQPVFKVLGAVAGVLVRVLTPALPVLIPLLVAAGGALLTLMVAAKVAGAIKTLAVAGDLLSAKFGRRGGGGATGAVGLFGEFLGGMRDGAREAAGDRGLGGLGKGLDDTSQKMGRTTRRASTSGGLFTEFLGGIRDGAKEAYSERGLGGLNVGLDTSTRKMDRAKASAKGLAGKLGGLRGAAAAGAKGLGLMGALSLAGPVASAVQGGSPSTGDAGIANASAGGSAGIDQKFKDAKWANGNAGGFQSFWSGTMNDVNNAGDAAAQIANMDMFGKGAQGINDMLGFENSTASAKNDLASLDSSLASMVQSGNTVQAGQQFNTLVFQAEAKGASQQDIMGLFPSYKQAVYDIFTQRGQQADDAMVLSAMRSDKGFRRGGYTGDAPVNAPVDVVHGREYVFDAATTARIGVDNLRAMHHGVPVSNSTATHFSPTVNITAGAGANGAEIRAHVDQALREAERRMRNTHGTRSKVGAR